ncbi:MAG: flavin-nucleotide-binding protein [Betaproteobacteria bacterium]|nr:flavin-nucleotide-binding protein [Betaproteobacteria bacterium]
MSSPNAALRDEFVVSNLEQLQTLYGEAKGASIDKETPVITAHYRKFIEAAPFFALATVGPEGMDCSPRGDAPGFVRVVDEKTLMIPDRRGNNRIDSLRNLMHDSRVALLFLIPGVGETFRVNGRAKISVDPELLASFAHEEKAPRCVLVVEVETVFFQCSRAVLRSRLWDPAVQVERKSLPSNGQILSDLTQQRFDGEKYDRELPLRIVNELY